MLPTFTGHLEHQVVQIDVFVRKAKRFVRPKSGIEKRQGDEVCPTEIGSFRFVKEATGKCQRQLCDWGS